jgi:hypothetical protein
MGVDQGTLIAVVEWAQRWRTAISRDVELIMDVIYWSARRDGAGDPAEAVRL